MEWKNNLSLAEREETLTPSCTSRPRVACEKWNRVSICYKRRGPATNCAARPRPRVSSTPGCPSSWARPGSRRRRPRPGPPRRTTIGNPWQPAALAVAFYHRHPPPSGSWRWARATRDWSRGGGPSRGPPEPPLPPGGRNGGSRRPLGPRSPLPSRTRPSGPLSQPYERTERPDNPFDRDSKPLAHVSPFSFSFSYHLEWRILNEDRFGELGVVRLREVNTLSGEGLQDAAMILIVIIWIRVDVRQRQTVQLCIGKCVDDLRLQVFLILKQRWETNGFFLFFFLIKILDA